VLRLYSIFRRIVLGVLFIAFSAVFGQWCINVAEQHQFFENPLAVLKPVADGVAYVQNLPGFWIAIAALSGLAIGMYLDAFMRRHAAKQPSVKEWLDPLAAIEAFADGVLLNNRDNARHAQSLAGIQYDSEKRKLDGLIKPPPFGSSGGMVVPESEEVEIARARLAELRTRLTASGEPILKIENAILDDMISRLKRESLVARAFRVKNDKVDEELTDIPASHWILLKFNTYDTARQTVEGGGKYYKGLQIGWNESKA
jgi:hypothetical protein